MNINNAEKAVQLHRNLKLLKANIERAKRGLSDFSAITAGGLGEDEQPIPRSLAIKAMEAYAEDLTKQIETLLQAPGTRGGDVVLGREAVDAIRNRLMNAKLTLDRFGSPSGTERRNVAEAIELTIRDITEP